MARTTKTNGNGRQTAAAIDAARTALTNDIDAEMDGVDGGAVEAPGKRGKAAKVDAVPPAKAMHEMQIAPLQLSVLTFDIVGITPLICHAWSKKAIQEILDKQMKAGKKGREAKNPDQDFVDSLYPHPDGGYGFPAVAFKNAAVGACRFVTGMKMTEARGVFHINEELIQIFNGALDNNDKLVIAQPTRRQDMVRVGMGVADIRFRGEFRDWRCRLKVNFDSSVFSPEQILNLFKRAGFGVGIGEWRPERNGPYGRFDLDPERITIEEVTSAMTNFRIAKVS
jgi:hypothetical protein